MSDRLEDIWCFLKAPDGADGAPARTVSGNRLVGRLAMFGWCMTPRAISGHRPSPNETRSNGRVIPIGKCSTSTSHRSSRSMALTRLIHCGAVSLRCCHLASAAVNSGSFPRFQSKHPAKPPFPNRLPLIRLTLKPTINHGSWVIETCLLIGAWINEAVDGNHQRIDPSNAAPDESADMQIFLPLTWKALANRMNPPMALFLLSRVCCFSSEFRRKMNPVYGSENDGAPVSDLKA